MSHPVVSLTANWTLAATAVAPVPSHRDRRRPLRR